MADAAQISEPVIETLKRLRKKAPAAERCELCALRLDSRHAHLLEPKERRIVCACDPCAFLFQDGAGRYRRIPRDVYRLADFALDELRWEALSIPINLAFFFFSSVANRPLALYPSPAGATESLLHLDTWSEIASSHTRLLHMKPDVEALLANRLTDPAEYYLVPIDRCYELAGIVRKNWKGFTGGDEVWSEISRFFIGLNQEAVSVGGRRA